MCDGMEKVCECDGRKEHSKLESKCRLSCYVCLDNAMYIIFPYL